MVPHHPYYHLILMYVWSLILSVSSADLLCPFWFCIIILYSHLVLILNYSLIGIKSACKAMLCSGVFMITLEFVSVLTHRFIIFSSAERLNLRSVSDYKYLNQSGCATIGGVDDAKNFHQLMVYFLTVCLI